MNNRRQALASVPFASMFYCSNPLAAALSRRRIQLLFFVIAIFFMPQLVQFARGRVPVPLMSQHFKFTVLARPHEALNTAQSGTSLFPRIAFTQDSVLVTLVAVNETIDGNDLYFSFPSPFVWNGWHFKRNDNFSGMRFALYVHSTRSQWRQVGSSTLMQMNFASRTVFLNGEWLPPSPHASTLPLESPRPYNIIFIHTVAFGNFLAMSMLSAVGRVRLAANLGIGRQSLFLAFFVYDTVRAPPFPGDYTFVSSACWSFIEAGALVSTLCQQTLYMLMWYGGCCMVWAVMILPHGPEGHRAALSLGIFGIFLFVLGAAVKAHQLYTRAAARAAIDVDRRHYDAIWAEVLRDPWACVALDNIATTSEVCAPSAAPRQSGPARPKGWLGWVRALLRREDLWVVSDLECIYADAAAADPILRQAVLDLAGQSGGLLPAAKGGGSRGMCA